MERDSQSKQTQLPQLDRHCLPMVCLADTPMHSQRMEAQEELQQLKEKLRRQDEELKESKEKNRHEKDESASMKLQMLQEKADLLEQQLTEAQQDPGPMLRSVRSIYYKLGSTLTSLLLSGKLSRLLI